MIKCHSCSSEIPEGHRVGCPKCGYLVCDTCKDKTMNICPNCYSSLEYIG